MASDLLPLWTLHGTFVDFVLHSLFRSHHQFEHTFAAEEAAAFCLTLAVEGASVVLPIVIHGSPVLGEEDQPEALL